MVTAYILLKQIGIMFFLMLIGYWLFRKKLLSARGSKELGNILLLAATPCIVIQSFLTQFTLQKLKLLAEAYLLAGLALLLSVLVARLIFGRKYCMEHFGAAFSNAGFLALPLVKTVLGEEAVFYASAFVVLLNILQWTYGIYVITSRRDLISLKKIISNPVIAAAAVGLVLFFLPFEMPSVITGTLSYMSGIVAPLAMLILGAYLAQTDIPAMFKDWQSYKCSFVRLLLIPLLTLALFTILPFGNADMKLSLLIAASAPVGANVAVMAQIHDLDYTYAVKSVCLSTVFCIFTMPFMTALADIL
ncbi:AEC family transporter [Lachnospiraceae bacterium 54-53]